MDDEEQEARLSDHCVLRDKMKGGEDDDERIALHVYKPNWYTIKGKRYNHTEIMNMLREKYKG